MSLILFIGSSFSLGAINPPLDSARLDIIHPKLWGARGISSGDFSRCHGSVVAGHIWLAHIKLRRKGQRVARRILIMLIPLAIAGVLGFITFHTYPPDAAAAAAYRKNTI